MDHSHQKNQTPFWKSQSGLAFLVAALVGGFYLITEHKAHLYGVLPYLFLLACPLMHIFMHRGHHHGEQRDNNNRSARDHASAEGRERE